MTDITLTLDHHEFYFAVRGFINGSHLSQDVYETIIFPAMRQMDDEFMNYLWWTLRRNHFDQYMQKIDGTDRYRCAECGADDYMHALAALHQVNRFKVRFVAHDTEDENVHECICYRFRNTFRPLYLVEKRGALSGFNSFIPDEWVESSEWTGMDAQNEFVEARHQDWWQDIRIYDTIE